MAIGPGKYDDICTRVREETDAELCCLIIGGGKKGDGMALQLINNPALLLPVIEALRTVADTLEADFNSQTKAVN